MKSSLYPRWSNAPRYWSRQARPPYRFMPQLHPHPSRHRDGHSYERELIESTPLDPTQWFKNAAYRYGIDLYHEGYVWEAHEVWEGLWKRAQKGSPQRILLHALILNTTAQLKFQESCVRGARILSLKAYNCLKKIPEDASLMGLDCSHLLAAMKHCYAPLWESKDNDTMPTLGPPPRLQLTFPSL